MTDFTPGPWQVNPKAGFSVEAPDKNYRSICSSGGYMSNVEGDNWFEENIANARLIAAAPDMYEALRAVLDTYTGLVNCGDCGNWNPEEEAVISARAALAKAEGK